MKEKKGSKKEVRKRLKEERYGLRKGSGVEACGRVIYTKLGDSQRF